MKCRFVIGVVGLCWLSVVGAAEPAADVSEWRLRQEESTLGFEFEEAGRTQRGEFRRFEVMLRFDPARLDHSGFEVTVDMASVDTGDEERDRILRSADLFHVQRWPTAQFRTLTIERKRADHYVARAELRIRDKARRLDFPFTLIIDASEGEQTLTLTSDITLHRLDYGVGRGEWRETDWVKDPVRVITRIRADRDP